MQEVGDTRPPSVRQASCQSMQLVQSEGHQSSRLEWVARAAFGRRSALLDAAYANKHVRNPPRSRDDCTEPGADDRVTRSAASVACQRESIERIARSVDGSQRTARRRGWQLSGQASAWRRRRTRFRWRGAPGQECKQARGPSWQTSLFCGAHGGSTRTGEKLSQDRRRRRAS